MFVEHLLWHLRKCQFGVMIGENFSQFLTWYFLLLLDTEFSEFSVFSAIIVVVCVIFILQIIATAVFFCGNPIILLFALLLNHLRFLQS